MATYFFIFIFLIYRNICIKMYSETYSWKNNDKVILTKSVLHD